jgi:hypothetical protein
MLGAERASRLRTLIRGALVDAYTENCNRYSEELGDNNLTFAVSVVHNLRHMLEEALEFEEGIEITRPRGSFQVEIDRRYVVHFYKVRSGAGDVGEMRFGESRTKLDLIAENTEQLSLDFGDEPPTYAQKQIRQLVVLHSGTPADGVKDIWIGAPYLSGVNGLSWAWLETFADDGQTQVASEAHEVEQWVAESELPELVVRLRESAQPRRADGSMPA